MKSLKTVAKLAKKPTNSAKLLNFLYKYGNIKHNLFLNGERYDRVADIRRKQRFTPLRAERAFLAFRVFAFRFVSKRGERRSNDGRILRAFRVLFNNVAKKRRQRPE